MPADELADFTARRPGTVRAQGKPICKRSASRQLSLFEIGDEAEVIDPAPPRLPPVKPISAKPGLKRLSARARQERPSRTLKVEDMPAYPEEAHESVAAALDMLPKSQLWFTYKDVNFFFGVSRATTARRLREGLVPGVRMAGSSVMEDAAVRRFDRGQLKWLLLAVRHRARQSVRR